MTARPSALDSRQPLPPQPATPPQRKLTLDGRAVATLVVLCLLWGLNQVAAKVALTEVPPLVQAAARSLGGAALVWAWATMRGIKLFERDGTLFGGVLAGVLFASEFACVFIGLQFTTASRMVVFLYLAPFVVALGMPFIARSEALRAPQILGLMAGFACVAWAFAEGFTKPAAGPNQWIGDALGLVACICWAATTFSVRASKLTSASPEKTLLYQLAVSGVALALGAWFSGQPVPTSLSTRVVLSLLFQTVIVCFASFLAWFWLIRHYPATRLSAFTLLTPVFGLLMGAVLLGEPITTRLIIALCGVVFGIWMVNRPQRM
ncbi:MAG: multidrug transporter permease [Rhizobacter sp.]|nr:multidrug transporter permease [Rhizobacter sp.]